LRQAGGFEGHKLQKGYGSPLKQYLLERDQETPRSQTSADISDCSVEEENARCVGSCNGSMIRVEVERMREIKYEKRSQAVEYEIGKEAEWR
jgi:hypothetical protein